MKHLKKYSELEEINEISKELGKRAADIALTKGVKFADDKDELQADKLLKQYNTFMKGALGSELTNEIEKLGYDLDMSTDEIYLLKNGEEICFINKDKFVWDDKDHISTLSENEKRKLLYLIKLVQKNMKDL